MKKNQPFGGLFYSSLKKPLLIMRFSLILMILGILQVQANNAYSQKTRLSINLSDVTLVSALDKIEVESEFFFLYNEKLLDTDRKVSINAKDQLISSILDDLFVGTDVNYTIIDRKVILAPNYLSEKPELQQKLITGTVIDKDGTPLPGVNVVVSGTTQGTLTDIAGKYSINVPFEAKSLTFSFIGMLPQEISIGESTQINVKMVESAIGLDEVVVIGYGTAKKTDLTGSVGSVDNASLQKTSVTNVGEAISGKLAGVQMRQNEGAPGSTPEFIIRGIGSITAGATPLYVIDGFPIDNLKSISPNSIERIDVLKDASATAIYGSRGSNGVILITTKRGMAGKTNITFNTSFGLQKLLKQPPYMRAAEMGRQTYYAILNRNVDDGNDVSGDPRSWKFPVPQISLDWYNGKTTPTEPDVYGTTMPDVNWIDLVMQVAPVQRYDLSVTGGTEAFKYAISGDYTNQDGILRNTNFKRYTLQANFDGQLTKKLKVKVSLNPSYTEDNGPNPSGLGYGTNILGNVVAILPYTPPLKPDGDYFLINNLEESGNYTNAWTLVNELQEFTKRAKFIGNINLEYSILDALKFNVMFAGSFSANKHMFFVPKLPSLNAPNANGTDDTSFGIGWINEYTLNYVKDFGDHHFAALAGFTAEDNRYYSNRLQSIYYPNNLVPYLSATSGLLSGGTADLNEWALVSYLSRINYTYKDKYYVTTSIRTDGSSRFGSEHRYGVFPSLALGWRISNENFLKDVSFLSNLKLRASYGQTGNNNIGNYESSTLR